MATTTNAHLALSMMLEKFQHDVLPGESGWDAIEAARAALAAGPVMDITDRERLIIYSALGHLRRTHQRTEGRIVIEDGVLSIHPAEIESLANRAAVEYAMRTSK